eukprot:15473055-Alexandrium_andersonii.AAC.2
MSSSLTGARPTVWAVSKRVISGRVSVQYARRVLGQHLRMRAPPPAPTPAAPSQTTRKCSTMAQAVTLRARAGRPC